MLLLIAKRLAAVVVILLALTAVLFLLQHISPADPVKTMLGPGASQELVAQTRRELGLDDPISVQYVHYVGHLLHGDLGTSYRTRRPVGTDLATFLPATLELTLFALVLALVLAVALAVATTLNWPGAGAFRLVLLVGAAMPAFLLAIGGIILFYKQLGWLPATGRTDILDAPAGPTGLLTVDSILHARPDVFVDALRHLLLPGLAIAIGPAVSIGRVLRSSLVTTQRTDYTRTARAKGLTEVQVMRRHVLRNSVGPALSMTGLQVGLMFAGVLVVELIFAWPGLGQYTAQSIPVGDYPAIAGVMLLLGGAYVVINTVVDLLQAAADPRIEA
ncbi:MAG: peptide/nickel transport system permease protein [Pseudonocardiales bacterium]|nr:gsiC 2 [Pseudonocardia sp.]MDT7651005.1 peptide/nickel transport system permease protein [Pseudonocardiales bacterium]